MWLLAKDLIAVVPTPIKFAAVALLAVVLAFYAGKWHGASVARSTMKAEIATATVEQMRERGMIDESVKNLTDCQLVRELNHDSMCE